MKKVLLTLLLALWCTELAIPATIVHKPIEALKRPPSESECMAMAIYREARGESLRGQKAVLDAIHTRMRQRHLSACEVVMEYKQFSGLKKYMLFDIPKEALTNYENVVKLPVVVKDCAYYHATYVRPEWANKMIICKQLGLHIFYKNPERK